MKLLSFVIVVLTLGYSAFSPILDESFDVSKSFQQKIASISSGTAELEVKEAMRELVIKEISINEFKRRMTKLEREFDKLLVFE